MIRTITITLLFLLFGAPFFAQTSETAATDAISLASLNDDFDRLKDSLNQEIPLGIQSPIKWREQLRDSKDLFLLDDANTFLFACVSLEDSLSLLRQQVQEYKRKLIGDNSSQAQNAKDEINSAINMPDEFLCEDVTYEGATTIELDAINALKKRHMKMQFILNQMRRNLADAHEHLAFEKSQ